MDYDRGFRFPSNPSSWGNYTIDIGGQSGLPTQGILSKFESTDTQGYGDEEMAYNNFMRGQIMSYNAASEPTLESDLPRTNNYSRERLNLKYYGSLSGNESVGNAPEIFTEDSTRDTRAAGQDGPDMRGMTSQANDRMRFQYMYPDADNSISQGVWDRRTQSKASKVIQELMRARLQIFSTGLDGKRNGMRRNFAHKSTMGKSSDEADYGEIIKNDALNPQRATTILSNRNLQRTKLYMQNTTDHDFQVSRYGEGRRGNYLSNNEVIRKIKSDNRYSESDPSILLKNAGVLMSKIINQKKNAEQNIEYSDAILTQDRKSTRPYRDMSFLMRDIATDQIMNQAYAEGTRKLPGLPNWRSHTKDAVEADQIKPAHQYINAELMYKGTKKNADTRKIAGQIITDDAKGASEDRTQTGKTAHRHKYKRIAGDVAVDGQSTVTQTYKSKNKAAVGASVNGDPDQNFNASDNTSSRKTTNKNYRNPSTHDNLLDSRFLDNTSKDRRAAPLTDKHAIRRQIETDTTLNDEATDENSTKKSNVVATRTNLMRDKSMVQRTHDTSIDEKME